MRSSLFLFLFFLLCFPSFLSAETLLGKTKSGVRLFLDQKKDSTENATTETVRLAYPKGSNHKPKVFYVPNPHRLVVDFAGARSVDNLTFPIASPVLLSKVRIGAHPNKLRVVLDISSEDLPSYTFEEFSGGLTITLSDKSLLVSRSTDNTERQAPSILAIKRETNTSKEASVAPEPVKTDGTHALLQSPTLITTQADIPKEPTSTKTKLTREPAPEGPLLTNLDFRYLEEEQKKNPVIVLSLTTRPNFTIRQEKAGVYKVYIKGHKLGSKRLKLPFFPPHDFEGMNGMKLTEGKKGVVLTLLLEPGSKLKSFTREKEIFLHREAPQEAGTKKKP